MIPVSPPERLALPAIAPPPPRAAFPFVATAAPVLMSLGIWAVTGSVYSLLFAALGPAVALGSLLDGRRQRRGAARRDADRAVAALGRTQQRVLELQRHERARLQLLAPALDELCLPGRVAANWARPAGDSGSADTDPLPVRIGQTDRASVVIIEEAGGHESDEELPATVRSAVAGLRQSAAFLRDAPWLIDARDGVGIVGPLPIARALARSIVLQLAANCSPLTTGITAASDEEWLSALPHPVTVDAERAAEAASESTFRLAGHGRDLLVACAPTRLGLPPDARVVIDLGPVAADELPRHARLELAGLARARAAAGALATLAAEHGLLPASRRLPEAVRLTEVLTDTRRGGDSEARAAIGLRAPVGRDASGVVELDLVRDGPHAVVAGTTGAGKSELLVSWVLAMAARHPPSAVTFLLVDFKGGAAFAPLAGLPHVIGTVSDLDARRSARAIESLRAELLRRERLLAERGVRAIDELESRVGSEGEQTQQTGLARLVIVVDEFAAVVSGQPELHDLFADLSARGRSLGLHLILCTQRPSGVVRDAVLANVTMRISLRVTDSGDSIAMLGSDAATRLAPELRGRALVADGSGALREVQLALAEPGDAQRLAAAGSPPSDAVWCDPLPELLPWQTLLREADAEGGHGIPFGRVDLPAEQRQPIARHDPAVDGHLLVLGAARSGRTAAMRAIADGARNAGLSCVVISDDPAEAWSIMTELLERPETERSTIVLLDDLDLLLGGVDSDARYELLELLSRFVRGARGRSLVISAQRLAGGLQALAGLFDGRLLLRQASRDEHVLAGGDGTAFDPRLPAGAGRWTGGRGGGAVVQVAVGAPPLPAAELVDLPILRAQAGRPLAVVCPRPREFAKHWQGSGTRVVLLGDEPAPDDRELLISHGGSSIVLLGDPDAWQSEWALLGIARRELAVAVIGCSPSELRAVARSREIVPPLGSRAGECWWLEAGVVRRALLETPQQG